MMKKIFRKLRSRKGLTLLEMMICVGLMAIIGAMVSSIVAVSSKVYAGSNFTSEAQSVAATLDVALGDMLNYAENPHMETDPEHGGGILVFSVPKIGAINVRFDHDYTEDDIEIPKYLCYTCNGTDVLYYPVQPAAYGTIQMSLFKLTYSGGIFTATFTLVSGDPALAGNQPTNTDYTEYTFTYRPILNQ